MAAAASYLPDVTGAAKSTTESKSSSTTNANGCTLVKEEDVGDVTYDTNELLWEEDTILVLVNMVYSHEIGREVTVEFTDSPSSSQKEVPRRIFAKDKVNLNYQFVNSE
ncbi:hypothetical protein Cni_G28437 [Canna indica]|uniref:Uncharacterized protein n=1 Tax=Canna indica TaxID=4628 RepID=A0AAQ3QT44_9LILI|nr:hypothetical protein Cni_G28437 [Canna indica]